MADALAAHKFSLHFLHFSLDGQVGSEGAKIWAQAIAGLSGLQRLQIDLYCGDGALARIMAEPIRKGLRLKISFTTPGYEYVPRRGGFGQDYPLGRVSGEQEKN